MKPSEKERILKFMLQGQKISQLTCYRFLGIFNLRNRIKELRDAELVVLDNWVSNGRTRYKQYFLPASTIREYKLKRS